MKSNTKCLYIVVPCFNESEVLDETASQLKTKLTILKDTKKIASRSKVIFVDDGSSDSTWSDIEILANDDPLTFGGVKLSRNRGHQNALFAGLMTVRSHCDMVISMDADLQDDIDAIDEMLARFHEGYDIVYGVRNQRNTDTWFKRQTAEKFYSIMKSLGVEIVHNHADYRLMSATTLESLSKFNEVNLFLRGVIPMLGYKSTVVEYSRKSRFAGESKYPLKKMLSFAFEGVTSFSIKPIRIVSLLGACVLLIGMLLLIYSVIQYFLGNTVQGWSSVLVSLWVIGGAIMISMGIIGEYIGKIYLEVKARPRYIVEDYLNEHRNE